MRTFTFLICALIFAISPSPQAQEPGQGPSEEQLAADKAHLEQWANKLYGLFGKKADTDRDGVLSIRELRVFCDKELKPHKTSKNDLLMRILKKQNPKMDMNQDKLLTKPELLAYMDLFDE